MTRSYFHDIYLFGLGVSIIVRVYYALKAKRREIETKLPTLLIEKLLMFGWGLSQIAACLFVFTDWLETFDYSMPVWLSYPGAALFIGSVLLLWRSHYDLGDNWSPEVALHKGQKFVTGGVYKYMRHPMYIAHLVWSGAQLLLLQNWIAGPPALVIFVPFYMSRIPKENKFLETQFRNN